MKSTEPTWLMKTIHQPRPWSRRLWPARQGNQEPAMSTIARWPEMRKSRQPMMSGFQTRRSTWVGVSSPSSESTRLMPKTIVPAKRTAAAT